MIRGYQLMIMVMWPTHGPHHHDHESRRGSVCELARAAAARQSRRAAAGGELRRAAVRGKAGR
jgi:hypothetical protein